MDNSRAVAIAYFDGYTIDEVKQLNLSHRDIVQVGAKCFELAHLYPATYYKYIQRSFEILALSEQVIEDARTRTRSSAYNEIADQMGWED